MKTTYMTTFEIEILADEAMASFEMTASWRNAGIAAAEFAADEWGIRATKAQVATAIAVAQTAWQGVKMSVEKKIS